MTACTAAVAVVIMGISLVVSAVFNYLFVRGVHDETMAGLEAVDLEAPSGDAMQIVAGAVEAGEAHANFAAPFLIESTTYMQWAAIATTIAMMTGFLLSLAWLWKRYGAAPPWATVGRILLVTAVLWGINDLIALPVEMVVEYGKIVYLGMVVGKMTVMGVVALVVLFASREFTKTDMDRVKAVICRKKKSNDETTPEDRS